MGLELNKVYLGDALEIIKTFPDACVNCVVTSPPYYMLRDYGIEGQIGMEKTPEEFVGKLVELFGEIRRVLKDDGTLWVNLGDSYSGNCSRTSKGRQGFGAEREGTFTKGGGLPPKNLIGIPWRFAFAMQEDGWILRQDIIWSKGNPLPNSVTDRCTTSHEYIFLFAKKPKYYFDYDAIMEECSDQERKNYQAGGRTYGVNPDRNDNDLAVRSKDWMPKQHGDVYVRNKRDVWNVNIKPNTEAHFATYPEELIVPCILAGCPEGGIVLDPFMGSGTTGIVARKLNRNYLGCELNPEYQKMAERRIFNNGEGLFNQ